MLSLSKPSPESVRRFLASQSELDFTYAAVGATAGTPPAGYVVDQVRVKLGHGEATYAAARRSLERWDQFRLSWMEPSSPPTPIEVGQVVAVMVRAFGVWWTNANRIVYVIGEQGPTEKFGFAYGTLPGHAETGEERFMVEWDRTADSVWYSILAFSRPRHALARLGYPIVRRMQRRFARDSAAAMVRACSQQDAT